jgi:hypothetical protein
MARDAKRTTHLREHFFFPVAQQPLVGQDVLSIGASRSHSDIPHSLGLLWTSDQLDAETPESNHNRQPFGPPGEIRTNSPRNLKVADPRLRPRGHWDRL